MADDDDVDMSLFLTMVREMSAVSIDTVRVIDSMMRRWLMDFAYPMMKVLYGL